MCETLREPVKVLKSLSEKTTNKEYKFKRLYRNLYNPEFYFLAYKNISQSQGSMTPGVDGKSLDGMSEKRINALIESLKDFSYQPNPARRVYIEKKNSTKKRPLGIPSTEDKLVQEVVKMILESIYEPTVDFMTKKKVINKGIVPQYYVEDDHEPIIPKELFYRVQEEMARRASMNKSAVTRKKNQKSKFSSEYALTGLLLCGDCGQEYRRVTWSRNGKKKIVWRRSNRLTNGTKHCKKSETLEKGALNRAVMSAINRITCNDGDFVGAFRQNVIRVIGNYGLEQEPDEYDDKIKAKQEEMVALIAENAKEGSYTDEFDERYRKIAEEISTLKEEQIEAGRKKKLADNYEQRLRNMDSFLQSQTCQIPEFDNDLVRRLISSIKVVSADKLIIQFQSGIVMEQEISYD